MSTPMQIEFKFEFVSSVPIVAKQGTEARDLFEWVWVEASVWTERMLASLGNSVERG
jgi:hypothetical protein